MYNTTESLLESDLFVANIASPIEHGEAFINVAAARDEVLEQTIIRNIVEF